MYRFVRRLFKSVKDVKVLVTAFSIHCGNMCSEMFMLRVFMLLLSKIKKKPIERNLLPKGVMLVHCCFIFFG